MSLPTTMQLEARLREALSPTRLEVIDESAAHAGHVSTGSVTPAGGHTSVAMVARYP